jgi:hypothetical protein
VATGKTELGPPKLRVRKYRRASEVTGPTTPAVAMVKMAFIAKSKAICHGTKFHGLTSISRKFVTKSDHFLLDFLAPMQTCGVQSLAAECAHGTQQHTNIRVMIWLNNPVAGNLSRPVEFLSLRPG